MEEYKGIRDDLIDFLRTARGQDYDAAYYYIGKYDFNQSDSLSLEVVADMVLEKATAGKKNPYRSNNSNLIGVLYKGDDDTHSVVKAQISSRLEAEQKSAANGMTYVPESTRFVHLVSSAASMPTKAEFDEIERNIKKSQTFSGQFSSNLKKQVENPRDNIGIGWLVFFGIVIICVIIGIIY